MTSHNQITKMDFVIDQKIFQQYPDLKVGAIIIRNFDNAKRNSAVQSLLRGIAAQRGREFSEKNIEEEKMIKVWDQAYGNFGANPKKTPCSIKALLKRVSEGAEIPHINLLVDIYNYYSLKYLLPIGGEAIDWLCGDLKLTYAKGNEAFRPIGKIDVEEAKEGEVAYIDEGGITCSKWNYRECERTKFTPKTVNAVIFVEDLSGMHMDKFGEILRDIQNGIIKYVGGVVEPYILTKDSPAISLGVEGRKNINDGKIPKQEKAHFLSKLKPIKAVKKIKDTFTLSSKDLLRQQVRKLVQDSLKKSFDIDDESIKIEYPQDFAHGDYACNIALQLNKKLGIPPREIAEKIIENLSDNEIIEKVEVAGPGFINFFISQKRLNEEVEQIVKEKEEYGQMKVGEDKPIVVEYSAPNIAKPLGVHHLLSTIIGQSLHNIYKSCGFDAISINHVGDWGTQFGKLICAYKKWGNKETVDKDPINELLKLYVRFHEECEKTPQLDDEAREEFKKFEEGDKENRELWQWFVDESMKEINSTYDKIGGIHFDHTQGESFYEDKMDELLEEGKKLGVFVEGDEGSYIVKYEDPNVPPFVVQKKDGATLYSTRDFAALNYRIKTFKAAKILYVVDIAQTLHFKQLFEAASRFPWYSGEGEHVWFGRMHMKDKKMSTRKGNVILLDDVLDEATARALEIINEKSNKLENKDLVAKVLGIGAVKYNILSQNRTTDITFDWDRMLSLEGNSAPYLQYSYARAKSILRNKDANGSDGAHIEETPDMETKIMELARVLPKYKEQLLFAAQEYKPNILANYLYELAQKFNSFYNSVPVLRAQKQEDKEYRLKMVQAASQVIKNGLLLLGVEVVEEM